MTILIIQIIIILFEMITWLIIKVLHCSPVVIDYLSNEIMLIKKSRYGYISSNDAESSKT